MSTCPKADIVRDYAFDEIPKSERPAVEAHLTGCVECSAELAELRLTTAALAALPDREPPRRIAFVSDKVFEPSVFERLWNAFRWQGVVAAGAMALAVFSLVNRPVVPVAQNPAPVVTTASAHVDQNAVNDAVALAVSEAVAKVRAEDTQMLKTALAEAETRHEKQHQALMVAMEENLTVMQKRLSTYTTLAAYEGGAQ